MTDQLCLGTIDDTDEAFQPLLGEPPRQRIVTPHVEQEARNTGIVADPLVAVGVRGSDALDLHVATTTGRGRNGAGMSSEADQRRVAAEALAAELPNMELAPDGAYLRRTGITEI
jgi:hypothetical protein